VLSFRFSGKIYVVSNGDGSVREYPSQLDALRRMEATYAEADRRRCRGRKAARVHYILFDIRAHAIGNITDLKKGITRTLARKPCSCSTDAGSMIGILCDGRDAGRWHLSGIAPKLI
jgi:hypothetical protein